MFVFFAIIFVASGLTLVYKVSLAFTVEVPAPGGTLREGVIGLPQFINPLLAVTGAGQDLTQLIYSGLVKKNPDGSYSPDLATYTISPDYKTYTFVLRDNVFFHDGKPVTADDIEFTLTKAVDPAIKSPKRINWEGVTIQKINDTTIQFTLKQPYAFFLENATLGILPKHIWNSVSDDEFTFSNFNRNPIGSGPYRVEKVRTNSGGIPLSYELDAFPKYSSPAFISHISMYFFSNEEQMLHAYRAGDIDAMNSISTTRAAELEKEGVVVEKTVLPRIFGVFFNTNKNPALLEKEVRQALAAAIPKQRLIDDVLHGYGEAIDSPLPFSFEEKDHISIATSSDNQALEGALILEKRGWKKNATGIFEKTINKSTVTLNVTLTTSDVPELRDMAGRIRDAWTALGANVDLKIFETGDLNQNVIRPRNYEALLFGEVINRDTDLYAFWHSSERNDPGLNIALYTNSKVDKLLEDARVLPEESDRIAKYKLVEQEIQADMPAVFIYSPEFVYVVPKNLNGLELQNIRDAKDRFVGISSWYQETDNVWNIFATR